MLNTRQVLVVDDEAGIRFFLKELLQQAGHHVETAADGEAALEKLRDFPFDLAILDLHLGGRVDGMRILEAIKWRWPNTAVIILTAHGTLESALSAIREGVDGYLLKPAETAEVRQVIHEVLQRQSDKQTAPNMTEPQHQLQWDGLLLDEKKYLASLHDKELDLTAQEFKLLTFFMQNKHCVLSPTELVGAVHEYVIDSEREARDIIKWYIYRLRQKIEPNPSTPHYITNVRGVGYVFGGRS